MTFKTLQESVQGAVARAKRHGFSTAIELADGSVFGTTDDPHLAWIMCQVAGLNESSTFTLRSVD